MKAKSSWLIVIVVIAVLFCFAWSSYAQKQSSPKVGWQYLTVHSLGSQPRNDAQLNELGTQGWELVSVAVACQGEAVCYTTAYLKRPK